MTAQSVTNLTDANGLAMWGAIVDPTVPAVSVEDVVQHLLGIIMLDGNLLESVDDNGDENVDAAVIERP